MDIKTEIFKQIREQNEDSVHEVRGVVCGYKLLCEQCLEQAFLIAFELGQNKPATQ